MQLQIRTCGKNCAPLGYYAAYCGNSLPTFRYNLWVLKRRQGITTIRYVIAQDSTVMYFVAEA